MRSRERLQHHYDVECALAQRLMRAPGAERRTLYTEVYDELFRQVPDHPQITAKVAPEARARRIRRQIAAIRPLLPPGGVFLEVGPGDCALSLAMCAHAGRVIAVDVSNEITRRTDLPANFELLICDGASVAAPDASVDLVYSDQLMEHLHPDDAAGQLADIARVLKPGGAYVCITPNRVLGPHDITRYFDEEAPKGLHLVEYGFGELDAMFERAGFSHRRAMIGALGAYVSAPVASVLPLERRLARMSARRRLGWKRNKLARPILNALLGARLVAVKAG